MMKESNDKTADEGKELKRLSCGYDGKVVGTISSKLPELQSHKDASGRLFLEYLDPDSDMDPVSPEIWIKAMKLLFQITEELLKKGISLPLPDINSSYHPSIDICWTTHSHILDLQIPKIGNKFDGRWKTETCNF